MKWFPLIPFLLCSCSANDSALTEQRIFKKVAIAISSGNRADISESDYDLMAEYISEGHGRWIDLYPQLNKQPFLGMTSFQEGLNISMAYALTKNPSEVLRFVNEENIDYICGVPFIEPTQDDINKYYLKARGEIMTVSSSSRWKNSCLSTMDSIVTSGVTSSNQ